MAIYRFGRCELDNSRRRLLVAGIERHVEPGVFDMLQFLAEKGDAIATRCYEDSKCKQRFLEGLGVAEL